jgi:uncharacterized membrane protein (UPF0127 family)
MRRSPAHTSRALRTRAAAAVAATTLLLAACGGGDDEALTDARPVEDVPTGEDGVTDAEPLPDVPGVTGAEPSDDITTSADPSSDTPTSAGQVPPLLDVVDGWPETTVTLDEDVTVLAKVAADGPSRQQGLMNVPELPDDVGMLFLFDEPSSGGFWMKDTLVPLDIAYILGDEVVAVMQMDPCEADPCPTYAPDGEYDAALEVNQGALEEAGVREGSTVTWTAPVEVSGA